MPGAVHAADISTWRVMTIHFVLVQGIAAPLGMVRFMVETFFLEGRLLNYIALGPSVSQRPA